MLSHGLWKGNYKFVLPIAKLECVQIDFLCVKQLLVQLIGNSFACEEAKKWNCVMEMNE